MSESVISPEIEAMRRALFTVCESKEQLSRWVRVFLGIHLPDCIVSDESNSSPMDALWEIYNKAHLNNDENFSRVLTYANRGGGKTLSASILEVLYALHLGRDVIHLAAIFDQSQLAQGYCRDHFNKPYLRDFRIGQNVKKIEVCRYYNKDSGISLTQNEWEGLDETSKLKYVRKYNYLQIVLCTLQSTNGQHGSAMTLDELDVIPLQHRGAYEEAKHIPDPRDGKLPITLLTSTRKFSWGLVQEEITKAAETGLHVRHWNAIDITQPCLPERHKPELPRQLYYIDDANLKHITEDDYLLLSGPQQEKFYPKEGFAGCKSCPIFSACKGRLATHQQSKSVMLKPISSLINTFKQSSVPAVQTQVLCRQPDSSGLIYPKLNRDIHMKTASQMAETMTGEPQSKDFSKADLLKLMVERGVSFFAGMDFGFTHAFAVGMGGVFGHNMFVVTVVAMSGLELDEKISVCEPLREFEPTIYGDPEAPADVKTFRRKGFNMAKWDKYKGSVKAGIEIVRMKLMPAVGDPQLFFLKDDPGCELAVKKLMTYHFMTDAGGASSEEPDKDDDDIADCIRYLVMNVFAPRGNLKMPKTPGPRADMTIDQEAQHSNSEIMGNKITELTGEVQSTSEILDIKKGRFKFNG